jgi:hypothetical protein
MKVSVKDFYVDMEIKNKGIELDVSGPDGKHLGDLTVTKTRLIWCQGKTHSKNGNSVTWEEFITYMNARKA